MVPQRRVVDCEITNTVCPLSPTLSDDQSIILLFIWPLTKSVQVIMIDIIPIS